MTESISVVGLGKLGLCLAAVFAKKGYRTVAVDIEKRVVDAVNAGKSPIVEPGLQEIIGTHGGQGLRATLNHAEAIRKTDVTFILVATPSNPDGSFSNRHVESALRSLATAFAESEKKYHLFVISSTVIPGSVERSFIPLLEEQSGRKLHDDFDVCYDPDFVALGDVLNGFLKPELVVIGESSRRGGDRVEAIHKTVCESRPYIARMSLISAEIAKVTLNSYITVKISFANMLANVCQRIPGADVDAITRTVGADRRISPYYFKGGLAYGGTCFPRDTRAFITFAAEQGDDATLIRAVEQVNERQHAELLSFVRERLARDRRQTVGVLGLAFKPDTPVITESSGIRLIENLLQDDVEIVAYDPLAIDSAKVVLEDRVEYVSTAERCLEMADLCVITTPDRQFRQSFEGFEPATEMTVVDCWRLLRDVALHPRITYAPLGYADGATGRTGTR